MARDDGATSVIEASLVDATSARIVAQLDLHHGEPCACGQPGGSTDHRAELMNGLVTWTCAETIDVIATWVEARANALEERAPDQPGLDEHVTAGTVRSVRVLAEALREIKDRIDEGVS